MQEGTDRRLPIIAAAAVVLITVVAVVVLARAGGGSDGSTAAPPECLRRWNEDPAALSVGRHSLYSHGYREAEVRRLQVEGPTISVAGAPCAVIFASPSLDPERNAAVQVLVGGTWTGLRSLTGESPQRLRRLQSDAVEGANAKLGRGGALTPR